MKKFSFLIIPILLLHNACTNTDAHKKTELKSYPIIALQQKDTTLALKYVADIQACKNIEIHARLTGALEHIYVDEGQSVQKGQLLFRINTDELNISLKKADISPSQNYSIERFEVIRHK